MATRQQKMKVGIFLLVSTVIISGSLMLIAGYRSGEKKAYSVVFNESVTGLYEGGLVLYQGVEVGRVKSIFVGDDQKVHAEIEINPKKVTLYNGVTAVLQIYSLATGTMVVELQGGDPAKGLKDPTEPIPARESLVTSFTTRFANAFDDLGAILNRIKEGMKGMREGEIVGTVSDLHDTIKEVHALVKDLRVSVAQSKQHFQDMTLTFQDSARKISDGVDTVEALAQETSKLVRHTDQTVQLVRDKIQPLDVSALADRLTALADEIHSVAATVNAASQTMVNHTDTVQYNLVRTLTTLNETLESVRDLAAFLRDNPDALLRGRRPVRENYR